ncbi:MAG: YicC family protein [Nitrospinota bacterium]|nr:YicC family protein [Nitrospinota bacterium]
MILSMTGFARTESENEKLKCVVEIRSVNHRFLDISVRLPSKSFEHIKAIKDLVSAKISRGSVEITVSLGESENNQKRLVIDENLVTQYMAGAKSIVSKFQVYGEIDLPTLFSMKDIFKYEETEDDAEGRWQLIQKTVNGALEKLVEMRRVEGDALEKDILSQLDIIEKCAESIIKTKDIQKKEVTEKLRARLEELFADFKADEQRVITEAAILADRSDISEEIIRLRSHIDQTRELVKNHGPNGRKLEFILQEMNRETNTVGSKSTLFNISTDVIEIKSCLEKIREQAANIE